MAKKRKEMNASVGFGNRARRGYSARAWLLTLILKSYINITYILGYHNRKIRAFFRMLANVKIKSCNDILYNS